MNRPLTPRATPSSEPSIQDSLRSRYLLIPMVDPATAVMRVSPRRSLLESSFQLPAAEMSAAIDVQDVTSDRRRVGQVHDCIRDVLDRRRPTHR
jgi:hypothetical protein